MTDHNEGKSPGTPVAIVTGGSRNIGRAIAVEPAAAGAGIAIVVRSSRAEAEDVRIVMIAGLTGQTGAAHRAHVVSAKAGLIGLTKALALEFASHNITSTPCRPG